jgi:hypothetical protein
MVGCGAGIGLFPRDSSALSKLDGRDVGLSENSRSVWDAGAVWVEQKGQVKREDAM